MRSPSLSDQLETVSCGIEEMKFVPLDSLEMAVTASNVAAVLRITNTAVLKEVVENANKVFSALVLMDRPDDIEGLLEESLRNQHLPLSFDLDNDCLRSRDGSMHFPFQNWSKPAVLDFQGHKQWLFLAPVLDASGQLIKLDPQCPMPFTKSCIKGRGEASIVYWAQVHKAHQRDLDVRSVS